MKPIATLMQPLRSVDLATGIESPAAIERSDVCAVPAAAVVAEAMVCLVLADAFLEKFGGDSIAEIVGQRRERASARPRPLLPRRRHGLRSRLLNGAADPALRRAAAARRGGAGGAGRRDRAVDPGPHRRSAGHAAQRARRRPGRAAGRHPPAHLRRRRVRRTAPRGSAGARQSRLRGPRRPAARARGLPQPAGHRGHRRASGPGPRPSSRSRRAASARSIGDGLLARALQHEIDHLDGVLFVDRLPAIARRLLLRRLRQRRRKEGW